MGKLVGWKVYRPDASAQLQHIDTVFYTKDMTAEEVRKDLLNDGYVSDVKVRKQIHPASKTFSRYRN